MALNWLWSDKCGELVVDRKNPKTKETETYKVNLYSGNAWLIMLYEYKQDGEKYYNMWSFFDDKAHMNKCLGLTKGSNNIFENSYETIKRVKLKADKNCHADQIAKAFKKAFPKMKVIVEY